MSNLDLYPQSLNWGSSIPLDKLTLKSWYLLVSRYVQTKGRLLIPIAYVVAVQQSESSSWIHIKSNLCKISDLDLGYVVELLLDSTHSISNWGSPAHLLAFGLAWCSQGPKVKTKQFRAPRPWGHGAMPTFAWRYFEHVELYLQFTSSYCGCGNTPRHCILFVFIVFMVFAIVIIVVIISIRSFSTSLHLPFLYFDYIFPSNAEFDAFSAWLMRTSSRQRTCIHVAAHFQCRDVSSFIFESFEPFCQFTNRCFVSNSLTSVVSCLSCRWVARLAQWSKLRWRLQVCNQAWA